MLLRPNRPLSIVYLAFVLSLSIYLISSLSQCSSPVDIGGMEAGYSGDQVCASCHQEEFDAWKGSHHDLAMAEATPETVLGDFNEATLESKGITSRFFKRDGKFFVNTEGPDGQLHDYQVDYTFGYYPLQQYMVRFPGGRLQCLHTAWDSHDNKWFDLQPNERFKPDDWMHWTGGSMTWNSMCADCHSTHLEKNFDPATNTYDTQWEIIDVSCEACHGPGRQHVAYANSSAYKQGKKVKGSYMFLTGDLNNRQQVDQCARCHSFRAEQTNVFQHGDPFMDHYVPEILRPNFYHLDGQIKEEVYVYGSFLQSKMYRNNVKCTDCHNAHSLELVMTGNDLCGKCHEKQKYDVEAHHFHKVGTEGADCVSCHMPGKYYMVNDYRRDHSFRVPRPDLSVKYGTPNACNQCHTDKSDAWAAQAVVEWYGPERAPHYSDVLAAANSGDLSVVPQLAAMLSDTSQPEIVKATALWILGESGDANARQTILAALDYPDDQVRYQAVAASERMTNEEKMRYLAPRLSDSVMSIRAFTAYTMASIPDRLITDRLREAWKQANDNFREVLAIQADFSGGRMMQGQYYHKMGNIEKAEAAYRQAMLIDPYLAAPHYNLGNLYYQQGQLAPAEEEFRTAVRLDTNNVEAIYALGLLLAEQQKLSEAEPFLGRAAKLTANPRYLYNWGLALQQLNRPRQAEQAYLAALQVAPESAANLYALAILYLQQGQKQAAQPLVMNLLQMDPQNQQYQELLRAVR